MPRHPDFEKIFQAFMWRYCNGQAECDIGKSNYYAWLNKLGLDDTKQYQYPQETREKFSWIKPHLEFIKEDEQAKYFKVEALFPLSSMNRNVYTKDELIKACRTLIGKPVNLNHTDEVLPEVQIVDADYEDDTVECLDRIEKNSKALQMIERGDILQVSIEAACLRGTEETPEGSACKGQIFTGKALLTKDVLPGVPLTRIMPVEKLVESFTVTSVTSLDEKAKEDHSDMKDQKPAEDSASEKRSQTGTNIDFQGKITDLEAKYEALKNELERLRKPKEEPTREPCKCVLTKEGFWARFHQLRSEGASKSEAFRLVSLEVIEAATKKSP
jgi:hypothetical protein